MNQTYSNTTPDQVKTTLDDITKRTTEIHHHLSQSITHLDHLEHQLYTIENMMERTTDLLIHNYISRVYTSLTDLINIMLDVSPLIDRVHDNVSDMMDIEKDMITTGHITIHNKLYRGNIHPRCDKLRYKGCDNERVQIHNTTT